MVTFFRIVGRKRERRGGALVLTALAMIPLLAMVAFAVDWGRICVAKAELQGAADAAAMAAAWELMEAKGPAGRLSPGAAEAAARKAAMEYSALNTAFGKPLQLQNSDIEVGYLANPLVPGGQLDKSDPKQFNAVRVQVRLDDSSNGAIPMLFAKVVGTAKAEAKASATATFIGNVAGFRKPLGDHGPYTPMLPFALDVETWHAALNGDGPDEWKWDANANKFVPGNDGIREFNLYPQDTGSAGNRGIVKIGTTVPSVPHISRQILYGVSQQDWEFHNGSLTFNEYGELFLGGTPGIRAVHQEELSAIRGQGRIIPIFSDVEHDGNNAIYTIVEWGGISIVEVALTGGEKRVIAQATDVITPGAVPAEKTRGPKGKSNFVNSRVWLSQ